MLGKFAGGDGSENNPYLIEDAFDLDAIRNNLSSNYKLIKDIDLNIKPFNEGEGWKPLGFKERSQFNGFFDGDGYTIKNLYIKSKENYSALFFQCCGIIRNVILKNVNIDSMGVYTSSLSGDVTSKGVIENCCVVNGKVKGNVLTGGLVGNVWDGAIIKNCYSNVTVLSYVTDDIGGLVGQLGYNNSKMINCYSVSKVDNNNGGLIGKVGSPYIITNSYWDIDVSGQTSSAGGIGKTTEEMKTPSTYIGWDKEKTDDGKPIWILKEGQYPKLWFEKESKFLLKQNDKYYSIKNELLNLGVPQNDDELLNWYKIYGIEDLNDILKNIDSKENIMNFDSNTQTWNTINPVNFNEVLDKINIIDKDDSKIIKYNVTPFSLLDIIIKQLGGKIQFASLEINT